MCIRDRSLILETGKIARQADGAVMVTYGQTIVLCTAVGARSQKKGVDFFPLTVNYQEKTFAAGKIPGGFFKREGRPNEKETLTSRLIDRPIRPMFAVCGSERIDISFPHQSGLAPVSLSFSILTYDGRDQCGEGVKSLMRCCRFG